MNILFRPVLLMVFITGQHIFSEATAQQHSNTTIVYDITVQKKGTKAGIEETYNGGTRAVFITSKKARIRLTSLMRMQSIFFDLNAGTLQKATIIKESGKNKYLFRLTPAEWDIYNKKYDSLACDTSFIDSLVIQGYQCRKAVITPGDGWEVIVYYTNSIKINNAVIDPLFRPINGTVLQYEVSTRKGTLIFKAGVINHLMIDPKIFVVPVNGVLIKKYNPGKKLPKEKTGVSEENE